MAVAGTKAGTTPTGAFSPETLRYIRRIEIRTRRLVNELFAGRYLSTFKGRGMTFSEVREYQPGDDIRTIDWNVTARMDAPFVKQYAEERELTIILAVDNSASMRFGTVSRSKHSLAVELAAVLTFAAMRNNDKVGLLLFGEGVERYVRPRKNRSHALRILRDMLLIRPGGKATDLSGALAFLNRVQRKKAVVFLFSDFISGEFERELAVTKRHHDTVAVVIEDRRELELPRAGRLKVEDLETGCTAVIDTSRAGVREAWAAAARQRTSARDALFRKLGMDAIRLSTGEPYIKPLMSFFEARARRFR
jgi:uncharacterized protein (DUF58 family)